MNQEVVEEVNKLHPKNSDDYGNAIKEILQNIVLIGLSKTDFFKKTCFYGGTCLRIFYNLDRFSEDLDFTLNAVDSEFGFKPFFNEIIATCKYYGFDVEIKEKPKDIEHKNIVTAYLNTNKRDAFINCNAPRLYIDHIRPEEKIKIKLEADVEPPLGYKIKERILSFGGNHTIITADEQSLLAGKIHAILYRNFPNRVKGRDYYDFIFLVNMNVSVNLTYLANKIAKSNDKFNKKTFDIIELKRMLKKRIDSINLNQANDDLDPLISNPSNNPFLTRDVLYKCINNLKIGQNNY
ncbi:MAG: nucleotidyl transferase AbiEii/AbiGii toxin family protein [Bacilli bacterium]|nr:nucleotidyl transferase AbiEii/AbiGii toxin family protein [Bacilli bacterium]